MTYDEEVDTITDFSISDEDKLFFNGTDIVEESKALDFMTDDGSGNTQIKYGSGNNQLNLILTGISTSELSGCDFLIPAADLP